MYRAFELKIEEDILEVDLFKALVAYGKSMINNEKTEIEKLLREVCFNGTIDGTRLTEKYFPILRKDVFLSYSYNDKDLAYMVAGLLRKCFGLSVFVDSMFWGSADNLLKEIDDKYCLSEDGKTYDYHKRNYSTAHIHAMLMSAIMKVMDQAEIVIFLNTPNSTPVLNDTMRDGSYDEYTLSPWIFEEILLTTMLKKTEWEFYRRKLRTDEGALQYSKEKLRVQYKLPKEKLILLTIDDINEWFHKYNERRRPGEEGTNGGINLKSYEREKHPLNVLYELKCGVGN